MNSRGENNFITDLVACSLGLGGIQFLPHAAAKVGQVTSLRLSDLQVKASVLSKDGKVSKQGGSEGRCGGEKGAICVNLLQGNEQMLCAFDANSMAGITARDLMLTTPRKSDGSKSLT